MWKSQKNDSQILTIFKIVFIKLKFLAILTTIKAKKVKSSKNR